MGDGVWRLPTPCERSPGRGTRPSSTDRRTGANAARWPRRPPGTRLWPDGRRPGSAARHPERVGRGRSPALRIDDRTTLHRLNQNGSLNPRLGCSHRDHYRYKGPRPATHYRRIAFFLHSIRGNNERAEKSPGCAARPHRNRHSGRRGCVKCVCEDILACAWQRQAAAWRRRTSPLRMPTTVPPALPHRQGLRP